jgi:hypothetical protein
MSRFKWRRFAVARGWIGQDRSETWATLGARATTREMRMVYVAAPFLGRSSGSSGSSLLRHLFASSVFTTFYLLILILVLIIVKIIQILPPAGYTLYFDQMSPSFFVSLLILLPTIVSAADSKCYNLNGTELGSAFTPCKPASGSKHSGCCSSSDICLDSGLCMATTDKFVGTIWQNGCTDATGEDPACSKMCPQGKHRTLQYSLQNTRTDSITSEQRLRRVRSGPAMEYPDVRLRELLLPARNRQRQLLQ